MRIVKKLVGPIESFSTNGRPFFLEEKMPSLQKAHQRIIFSLLFCLLLSCEHLGAKMIEKNAYDFEFKDLSTQNPLPLNEFKGKVMLIVNTASRCGFTPQYAELEALYQTYKDKGFVVIGVPSNDFGGQEPGDEHEVAEFCEINYGVTFPMTTKEVVKGKNAHPFYLWAKKEKGGFSAPKWNFHKYLIDKKGNIIDYFYSTTSPQSKRVINEIEKALIKK